MRDGPRAMSWSVGSDSATGPGRAERNSANARWTAGAKFPASPMVSAHRHIGRKQSIWFGTSWSAPRSRPISATGISDMRASTGWEPAYDSTSGVSTLVAPGPVVTTTTPGRPDDRA